jgi:Matrixin/Bacterial Ig domain
VRLSIRIALATAALAVAITAWPTAYVLTGPKWAMRTVNYYINPTNADVSDAAAEAAVQAGAATWGSQSNADFRFYYMGRTSGTTLTNNGRNEVFFRSESAGGTIASTYWWADASNHLIDADIVFYDGGFQFFTGSSGCSAGLYIEDIAAHEFGHALGLGHSSDPTATMYPSASWCSTDLRTLASDDLAGVEALYPASGAPQNTAPSLTISAPANNTSVTQGTTVAFSGSATDQQDGDLSYRISWSSNLPASSAWGARSQPPSRPARTSSPRP